MAMDDIYRLARGIVLEGKMAKPDRVEELVPYGPWTKAEVVDTSLYINHGDGFFFGNVRYILQGEKLCKQASFNELWMQGWTSIEFMNECIAAQTSKCGGACGGFVQEGAYVHAETCTGKRRPKVKPAAEGYWTMDRLILWSAKKAASKDPEIVCNFLSFLRYDDIPDGAFQTCVKFRHKNSADRLRKVRSILRHP
jgi:hypothetical protein